MKLIIYRLVYAGIVAKLYFLTGKGRSYLLICESPMSLPI